MRRFIVSGFFFSSTRFFSDLNNTDELRWKTRHLQEKRDVALKYMGDIKLRTPIHESIRKKMFLLHHSSEEDISSILSSNRSLDLTEAKLSYDDVFDNMLQHIDELSSDTLDFLNDRDLVFLTDEFVSGDTKAQEETIKNWINLRRETSDYHNYLCVPENERTTWSAWYLKNVKSTHPKQE